jgi:hypothetical protein
MGDFLAEAERSTDADNTRFGEASQARAGARSFADGGIEQVDVTDLIERTDFEGKEDLAAPYSSAAMRLTDAAHAALARSTSMPVQAPSR